MPRILIVDDDHETCRFMADLLAAPGPGDRVGLRSATAFALVKTRAFDLVISDINLNAEQSGLDILRAFRDSSPRGHVLLISGFARSRRPSTGARRRLRLHQQPFDINEVKATVERASSRPARRPAGARARARRSAARAARQDGADARRYKQIAHAATPRCRC